MKKTFMILGGGAGQMAAITCAKELGMKVLVVDRDPACLGAAHADFFERVDTTDFAAVERVARHYNIVGSMTMSNDVAVPTSCFVNEGLGLPMQGEGLVELMTNKYKMRKRYAEYGVSSPAFYEVTEETDLMELAAQLWGEESSASFITKPSDGSGSQGITKLTEAAQLTSAVQKALNSSRSGRVIIEEFIEGLEIGAVGFCSNGQMEYCFVHNDKVSNMIPVGHSFPSFLSDKQVERIQQECERALKSLGLNNGPSNIDLIIDEQGTPYLIEIGARLPATRLPELVNAYAGIDLVKLTVQQATGESIVCPLPMTVQPVAAEMINFAEGGIVRSIHSYAHLLEEWQPADMEWNLKEGDEINSLTSGRNHYGHVTFMASSAAEAEAKCEAFLSELKSCLVIEQSIVLEGKR